jgi:tetratricopeptide (TPR) repeat protein
MNTKFNVLYNGNKAFEDAKKQLDDTYEDNYWERLPIEPLKIEDKIPMPGQSQTKSPVSQGFEKAEEKAVKAVQKHSMIIDDLERNNQIDDSYFLLGRARYYMQRFVPAVEAFTYAIEKYPNADLYYDLKIWKAKSNIRLQNERLAIETLNNIIRQVELPEETIEKAHTALAMAYTQLDSTQHVIDQLKLATYYFKDPAQSSRNMFILGQIYREEQKIDSSNMAFESLLYLKKVPHKYKIHAQIERAKNYTDKDSTQAIIFALRDLAEDHENKPYFDELYYQAGLIALQQGDSVKANEFFVESIKNNTKKPYQKSLTYEQIGNLYFNNADYITAGAYYDSVLQITSIDQNSKRIRKIIRKNASLEEVIHYENILRTNDSILTLATMDPVDQKRFFEDYVTHLKEADEQKKIMDEQQQLTTGNNDINNVGSKQNAGEGKFYFYNVQIVGFGMQEFRRKFGNRSMQDNWIFSGQQSGGTGKKPEKETEIADDTQKYNIDFYLSSIPKEQSQIDSIAVIRNNAYYNLGLLYKEQFKDYEIAARNFEKYLNANPNPNLVLPVKYHLFRCYENFNPELSNKYREDIVNNYPDSRYTQIISNPEFIAKNNFQEDSPEYIYKNAFVCYKEGDYDYALFSLNEIKHHEGSDIEPKVDLLKAFIAIKKGNAESGKKMLNDIIINFPNSEESKLAEKAIEKLNRINTKKK